MMSYKRLINIGLLIFFVMTTMAQSGVNSPYTRYGFGQLSDQSFGNSKAMGGIAYGLRNGLQINAANPASYSAVDSLTFLFDAGMSLQNTNFQENGVKTNAKNSTIDYIAMQFRLWERMGMTAGFLPYSSVGYNMSQTQFIDVDNYGNAINTITTYSGDGGLQQVFAGLGFKVFKNLSIGANFSYFYGEITHSVNTVFNNANAKSSVRTDKIEISDYKLDLGLQYTQPLGKKHKVNLGLVYSLGHDLNGTGYNFIETYKNDALYPEQTIDTIKNAFSLPHTLGIGATYEYDNRLTIGADYTLQKWEEAKFFNEEGKFQNRTKISVGAEFRPRPTSRNYLNRIRYRVGAYYSDPYTKVNDKEGAREYGVSFGFGLPLEMFQSRSILNISGQYIKVSPKVKGMLEENYLRINIGLTFNDRWFMKWKVE
ncbi:MAG: hypothetical protein IJE78_14210 [Bacteroidaceae bacterium]|nr:hypothetical protein [Bacteroidaceae bacterium]